MTNQSVIIDLPESIYSKYKRQAEQMQRSVEAEIVEGVSRAVPNNDELTTQLEDLVTQLAYLDDKALLRIARSKLAKKDASRIETLHIKRQSEGLTDLESTDLAGLMKKFDRWFVLRNEALGLLIARGQNVAEFARGK